MNAKEAVELGQQNKAQFVDLKFIDFPGVWQHTTIPANRLTEALFEDGIASMARRSEGGNRSMPPTCLSSLTPRRRGWTHSALTLP